MRITCPRCSANYEVPPARLRPGKLVRCARCGGDWLPEADTGADADAEPKVPAEHHSEDVETGAPVPPPPVSAMDRLAASPASVAPRASLLAAWILTFVVLAASVAATVGWRDAVIRTWPPSSRILAAKDHTAPQSGQTAVKKAE